MEKYYMEETKDIFEDDCMELGMKNLLDGASHKVFDDIVSEDIQERVLNTVSFDHLDYTFIKATVTDKLLAQTHLPMVRETHHFVHCLYEILNNPNIPETKRVSPEAGLADFMLNLLFEKAFPDYTGPKEIHRAKINIMTRWEKKYAEFHTSPHLDSDCCDHYVLLYYANDSDGETTFFDENFNIVDTVAPKKGRILLFNGKMPHASRAPCEHDLRIVLNMNFSDKRFTEGSW